jgi:hypothetical protein
LATRRRSGQWYRVDLHVHTPASADYHDRDVAFIDILRTAERRGLDIIAFTDHNTVNGYATMHREIDQLSYLKATGRATGDELRQLAEYQRLLDKLLVLPGFEFTATFGFHILGIFSPETPIRLIEHLLLSLNVPLPVLESGDPGAVGATSDVLSAYETIHGAGGLVIAAHANTTHGVAMRGMGFGGQTRMAYTQDRHLHALELTDLNASGRRSTQRLFDGTKPEYPRRMHCIQGSDSHSLDSFLEGKNTRLGLGERATELLLNDRSFAALLEMFTGTDFSRSRPYNPDKTPYDYIVAARDEGPSLVQSFYDTVSEKDGNLMAIVADVCAFANTNGGTIYIGISDDTKVPPRGVKAVDQTARLLAREIGRLISPSLNVDIDSQITQGKTIVRILVPFGEDRPYAIDDNRVYVRDEAETSLAVRDEIVMLVRQGLLFQTDRDRIEENGVVVEGFSAKSTPPAPERAGTIAPPQTGVEILSTEDRENTRYYTMQDLRNNNVVRNVTRSSARDLWHYAIGQYESNPVRESKVTWIGDMGLWRRYAKGGKARFDLVQRSAGQALRVYYGVTEEGVTGAWEAFLDARTTE